MFQCTAADIQVHCVDATCEVPSALAAEHNVWLFADGAVASVSPGSTRLARDWAEQWFLRNQDSGGRTAPLYQCRWKPQSLRQPRNYRRR